MKYLDIREEELKNKVATDFFSAFDTTKIVGNIDFCVTHKTKYKPLFEIEPLLWAEAKTGDYDVTAMFTQLILTIGKARTFDKTLPPAYLGAFDGCKIAFVPYNTVIDIFSMNDFNWNVAPSNHQTKEFKLIRERIEKSLRENQYIYDYIKDEKELKFFIKNNIAKLREGGKITIDKNNFVPIYLRWLDQVKPSIDFDWGEGKKQNILDSDFYLADLFVDDKGTSMIDDDIPINDNLFVVFRHSHYEIAKENLKSLFDASIPIKDRGIYEQFWKKYKRPPIADFQQYIVERRDLLVPQDVREKKGAFFTPQKWVQLSQQYIADVLGKDWQDEYYVWDCASGTGNLLAGLTNKYNIYASTLDMADVNVMYERIDNGANLLKANVFQFDFLNDDFNKLPQSLQNIINDPEKRKKLVIYINPPYAEADSRKGEGREIGASETNVYKRYCNQMGYTKRELYIQFLTRIYFEIQSCIIADFSKLKNLQAPRFIDFRKFFDAKLEKLFIVPANTFDNVKGSFPIGFFMWNTDKKDEFKHIEADIYEKDGSYVGTKKIWAYDDVKFINDWVKTFRNTKSESIATIIGVGSDFQNQRLVRFGEPFMIVPASNHNWQISKDNIIESSIYYTVRHIIDANWLNDRDQFLFPNNSWEKDMEFQSDSLTYVLFSNNIQSKFGTNNWIPFTEYEVDAKEKFESHFMTDFITGKLKSEETDNLFGSSEVRNTPLIFSEEALAIFDAGLELWRYYHKQPNINVNASLYDIREYFQGRNEKGKMNNKSSDEVYTILIATLRDSLKDLAKKIKPKVYKYGFLRS